MNFIRTLETEMAELTKQREAETAVAKQVWDSDFAEFCERKQQFITHCNEAGLEIEYVEEALKFPDPMPERIAIMTPVVALGQRLSVEVRAGVFDMNTTGNIERRWGYEVSCQNMTPCGNTSIVKADPDAQSLHDALVRTSKDVLHSNCKLYIY